MDPLAPAILGILIPIVAIVGGILVAISSIISRSRIRQLQIRERIAMIEKGLVPPPETDPMGFDRAMDRMERRSGHYRGGRRHRRAGVTLIGLGLGLLILISFAWGEPGVAVGVGGFLAMLGLAFLVNSFFETPEPTTAQPPTSRPTDPPNPPQFAS